MSEQYGVTLLLLSWEHLAQNNFESKSVSCLVVSDSLGVDGSPPGSSIRGILQARILEWTAMPFSRASPPPKHRTRISWLQANSLPPEPPGRLRITLAVSKYQAVVKGEDGIVKIQQVPYVWALEAVNMCSHVQSCAWVRASGARCRVCASSASCAWAYSPAQHYIENGSAVFFSQAQGIQKQA